MLFPATSVHDVPTLPPNGTWWLSSFNWNAHWLWEITIAISSASLQYLLCAFLAFLCLMLFLALCPLFFLCASSCLFVHLCFDMSHVDFEERRVRTRVPISSVALPQAAIAPPHAELWLAAQQLSHTFTCEKTVLVAKTSLCALPKLSLAAF